MSYKQKETKGFGVALTIFREMFQLGATGYIGKCFFFHKRKSTAL